MHLQIAITFIIPNCNLGSSLGSADRVHISHRGAVEWVEFQNRLWAGIGCQNVKKKLLLRYQWSNSKQGSVLFNLGGQNHLDELISSWKKVQISKKTNIIDITIEVAEANVSVTNFISFSS
jgi:hypothetical protein